MRKDKGFTLIELMVVIVIIAILAAVALPNFMGATEKARESAVTSAVKALQTSLEMYAVDHNGTYPGTESGGAAYTANALTAIADYLPNKKFPNNPVNNLPYAYDNGLVDVALDGDPLATAQGSGENYCIVYSSDGVAYTITGCNRDNSKIVITLSNH